jgi:diguanylate cyclase (GGDEF)-like protein
MFGEYLNQVIAESKRHAKQFALLYLDIDDFKRVNDTLGHQAGDQLLQEVTERLTATLRQADFVARGQLSPAGNELLARLGGDEFVILLPDINGAHAPGSLARRLLNALAEPVSIDDHDFYISASIGITVFPTDGDSADTLARNADIAMYHAKEQGKNDYQFYLESMNVLAHERLALENKLRKAIANHELCLYYQPQVETDSGTIVGLEALMRWQHPEDGNIPPDMFIPVAEETGLILELGEWVIDEACRQMHQWQQAGLPVPAVSINVSGHQFGKQNVARVIQEALVRNRLSPGFIEVEITESAIMEQPDRAVRELAAIKDLGVTIALDDFGTGYSSFSYLHRFPIDTLKIDRSFIRDIAEKDESAELVAAIIAMAHILKLRVVAEGIENREQLAVLAERECDVLQGYLFKAPVSADKVPAMLHGRILKIA